MEKIARYAQMIRTVKNVTVQTSFLTEPAFQNVLLLILKETENVFRVLKLNARFVTHQILQHVSLVKMLSSTNNNAIKHAQLEHILMALFARNVLMDALNALSISVKDAHTV